MTFSETLDNFAIAVRVAEHGKDAKANYTFYGDWLPNRKTRLLGAYKIPANQWAELAASAGVAKADWRSSAVQDVVAKEQFARLYGKYQDWQLVALAWKAGEDAADKLVNAQARISDIPGDVGTALRTYVTKTTTGFDADPNQHGQMRRIGTTPIQTRVGAQAEQPQPQTQMQQDTSTPLTALLRRMQANVRNRGTAAEQESPVEDTTEPMEEPQ